MQYRSTRGGSTHRSFTDVLLDGLAPDGGLYVPETLPPMSFVTGSYATVATEVVRPFVEPDPLAAAVGELAESVFGRFSHPEVAPLRYVGDRWLLELTWGPTLSFKDYALQLVGAMLGHVLGERGERMVILGATSGDTGAAAIEACRGIAGVEVVILYPEGGVTEIQRRQMTTVADAHVHAVAVRGTFDDCQRMVKAAFARNASRTEGTRLGAVNSINWARIVAQTAYYFYAAARIGEPAHFVVPTGNFGNVLSAHLARRMGAPIAALTVANNANRGLTDLVESGRLTASAAVPTLSPAMDIQVPSNLERYLYELVEGDSTRVRELQAQLAVEGSIHLEEALAKRLRADFDASWRSDADVVATMRRVHDTTEVIIDPHTAVAWSVADDVSTSFPRVVVSTAHPAKFPDAVGEATGERPALPAPLATRLEGPERVLPLPADQEALGELLGRLLGESD